MRVYDDSVLELTGGRWVTRGLTQVWEFDSPVGVECAFDAPQPDMRDRRVPCPTCGGKKSQKAKMCAACKKTDRANQPINHGTLGGNQTHRRRGEDPCEPCKEASRKDSRARRAQANQTNMKDAA